MQTFNNGQKNKEIQSIKVELHVSINKDQFDGKFCKTWVCIVGIGCNGDGPFKLTVYDADENLEMNFYSAQLFTLLNPKTDFASLDSNLILKFPKKSTLSFQMSLKSTWLWIMAEFFVESLRGRRGSYP